MKRINLKGNIQGYSVVLNNDFIDHYMPKANGEFVKVYLLLLRHFSNPSKALSISKIADILEITEKDVKRALKYWEKQGLLDFESESEEIDEDPLPEPEIKAVPPIAKDVPQIEQYRNRKEKNGLKSSLFLAESYFGKTLSHAEAEVIAFIYEELSFPTDLIDYLIVFCVENGNKSLYYVKKVAINWSEQGIKTVEDAKEKVIPHNKKCYSILKAFGITDRAPASAETTYIKRWCEEYGFSMEMILAACDRTINAIHKPSFDYAEKILKDWHEKKYHTLEAVEKADALYQNAKKVKPEPKNAFNNFKERSYDMEELERKLIQ